MRILPKEVRLWPRSPSFTRRECVLTTVHVQMMLEHAACAFTRIERNSHCLCSFIKGTVIVCPSYRSQVSNQSRQLCACFIERRQQTNIVIEPRHKHSVHALFESSK